MVLPSLLPEDEAFEAHPVNRDATRDNDNNIANTFFIIYTLSFLKNFLIYYFEV
jgi:hypothetical protein